MGYTTGRRLDFDTMKAEALKYRTRAEFQKHDPSCYTTARLSGVLDIICAHMKPCFFSVPQRICLQIFNKILNKEATYNTRKVVPPYELDLYYKDYNIGVEYCGKGWHLTDDAIKRDNNKLALCEAKGINLFIIKENNRRYEEDIKSQIIGFLDRLNEITGLRITKKKIIGCAINYHKVFELKDFDINEIKRTIERYSTIKSFRKENERKWCILSRLGLLHLLDELRVRKKQTNVEILEQCKQIQHHKDFVNNHNRLYQACHKRGILDEATSHMVKVKLPCITYEEIVEVAQRCDKRSDLRNRYPSHYRKAIKLNMLDALFPKNS